MGLENGVAAKYWDLISPFSLTLRDTLFICVSSTHICTQTQMCRHMHQSSNISLNGSKWLENSPQPFSSHFLNGSPDRMSPSERGENLNRQALFTQLLLSVRLNTAGCLLEKIRSRRQRPAFL